MARPPYRIARQQHLGDALDDLQRRDLLEWQWDYRQSRAIFRIREPGQRWVGHVTADAEDIVSSYYGRLGEPWRPVPHPGGEGQRRAVVEWITAQRIGPQPSVEFAIDGVGIETVAAALRTSERVVADLARARQLLLVQDHDGDWVAPRWQLDLDTGSLTDGVADLLAEIDPEDDEAFALWADEPCPAFDGMRPGDLFRTYMDVAMVVDAWCQGPVADPPL